VALLGQVAFILVLATLPARVNVIAAGSDPDCGAQIKDALAMLGQEKAREAEQLALAATKVCPKEPAAYNMLGMAYDSETRFQEGQTAYRQAISLDPKVAAFHDNLAVSYMRSGNQEEAVREFQTALKLDSRNKTANLNLGAYDLNQKAYRRAVDHFHAAEAETSGDPGALLGMIQAYFGAGEVSAGLRAAARLSAIAGSDPKVHFSLGLLLAEHGEYAMAVEEFEAIPVAEQDFAVALNLGMARSRLGQFKKARQDYEEALRLDPSSPEPCFRIGLDASASRNTSEAIYWISRAQDKATGRPDISYALAEELIRARNYERAHDLLSSALGSQPNDPMLLEALGDLCSRQNQVLDAIDAYLRCLNSDPQRVSARLSLARRYLDGGRAREAKTEFEKILQVQPDNPEANAGLGKIALEAGQRDAALQYAEKTLARDPDNLTANEDLAQISVRDGKLNEAQATLEKLVKLDPGNPRFHYLLSRVLSGLNRQQEAESEFELSKKLEAGRGNQ
jgi:tetratricopeptide (TPR) repeat protein